MKVVRIIGFCLAAVALALCAVGYYVYRSYPENLEKALTDQLAPYGITQLDIETLRLGTQALSFEGLALKGSSAAQRYSVRLSGLKIGYHWRDLLDQRVNKISIDDVEVSLEPGPKADPSVPEDLDLAQFLPQDILPLLPFASIRVTRWKLTYPTPQGELLASGTLEATQQTLAIDGSATFLDALWEAELSSSPGEALALFLDGTYEETALAQLAITLIDPGEDKWRWRIEGEANYAGSLAWLENSPAITEILPLQWPQELLATGSTVLTARADHPAIFPARFSLSSPELALAVNAQMQHRVNSFEYADVAQASRFELETNVLANNQGLQLDLLPTTIDVAIESSLLGIQKDRARHLGWPESVPLTVSLDQPVTVVWSTPSSSTAARLTAKAQALSLDLGNSSTRLVLDAQSLDSQYPLNAQDSLSLRSEGQLRSRYRGKALPTVQYGLQSSGPLRANEIELALADIAQSINVDVSSKINLQSGGGITTLQMKTLDLPYAAGTAVDLLSAFDLLTQPVSISSGSIELQSQLESTQYGVTGLEQSSALRATSVSGTYGEYAFTGLDAAIKLRGVDRMQTPETAKISLDLFDAGFPVSDILTSFALPTPTPPSSPAIKIETFSARLFGGSVLLPRPTDWQVGASTNAATVRAQNWELGDLVALQQGEDIQAAGRLEGELPLKVQDGRIIIEEGYLRAIPPGGSIRYQATDRAAQVAASNEQLGMALELLEDFQFNVLSTDVRLDKAGNLSLGLALSGRNPQQFDGRQINFNINVDQNLDPLLQSLRLGDSIVKKLEKQVR